MSVRLEACAKVFLAGEYAVLEPRQPALVVGIDLKLHAIADRSGRGLRIAHAPTGVAWGGGAPLRSFALPPAPRSWRCGSAAAAAI